MSTAEEADRAGKGLDADLAEKHSVRVKLKEKK